MRTLAVCVAAVVSLGSFTPAVAARRTIVIPSGNVQRLYEVIGDPANIDVRVVLEPGTYVLTADGPRGPRERGGGLLLQLGMDLIGHNAYSDGDGDGVWDASFDTNPVVAGETVIDGRGIALFEELGSDGDHARDCTGVSASFEQRGGVVIAYRDRNLISGVTVLASVGVRSIGEPHPSLLPRAGMTVVVRDVFADNGTFSAPGVTFANFGCDRRDARSRFTLERSIIRGHGNGVAIVNGLTHQAGDVRNGPRIDAWLSRNHILANGFGVHSRNTLGTDGGDLRLHSVGNLYEFNFAGIESTAGTDLGLPSGANGNRLQLRSHHDTFRDNAVSVLGVGFWRTGNPTASVGNSLEIELLDGHFEGSPVHLWPVFFEPVASTDTDNRISFLARGSTYGRDDGPRFLLIDTVPGDSNRVELVGSDTAFTRGNQAPPTRVQFLEPPVPFDLVGASNSLRFAPTPGGYGYTVTARHGELDDDFGDEIDFGGEPNLDYPIDDDTVERSLPFLFEFNGATHETVFINSDGNLTFGEGDPFSSPRDVARLVFGAPRIAPWLADLAPNVAGGVHVKALPDRFVVTWADVPTWAGNLDDHNTFQVTLWADGGIDFVYEQIESRDGVVGIAIGNGEGPFIAADLSAARGDVHGSTVFEEFLYQRGP